MLKVKGYFLSIFKILFIFIISCSFFVGIYFLLQKTGWIGTFKNVQELKIIIGSAGFWSYSVFVVLQFLQVTVIPLPASVTTIVGVILFGPVKAFLLSFLAIMLGSVFAYVLGRSLGSKLLDWAVGEQVTEKLQTALKKGKYAFFLMMLFPLFPDDILCLLAGCMKMDFKFFLFTNLITRFVSIFCLCFFGNFLDFSAGFNGL